MKLISLNGFQQIQVKIAITFSHFEVLVYASLCTTACKNWASYCLQLFSNCIEFLEDHIKTALTTEMSNERDCKSHAKLHVVNCLKNIMQNK